MKIVEEGKKEYFNPPLPKEWINYFITKSIFIYLKIKKIIIVGNKS